MTKKQKKIANEAAKVWKLRDKLFRRLRRVEKKLSDLRDRCPHENKRREGESPMDGVVCQDCGMCVG